MEKSTKMVMILALMLATAVASLEGRELKAEPKYEPQTFPGFPGGPGLGTGGVGSIPGFGLGQPAIGGGSPLVPGIGLGSNPLTPGGGFGGVPGRGGFGGVPGRDQP